ncbi:MAG: PilX N-terminal domain-containing pilus assembly protein [Acidobacteriota bacterium]
MVISDDRARGGVLIRRREEQGSALVLVLLFSLVVTAIGMTLLVESNTEHRISANERDSERARFAAHAGFAWAYERATNELLDATVGGTDFTSAEGGPDDVAADMTHVLEALGDSSFEGTLFDTSDVVEGLTSFRIEVLGRHGRAQRRLTMDYQILPEQIPYGVTGFGGFSFFSRALSGGASINSGGYQPRVDSSVYGSQGIRADVGWNISGHLVGGRNATLGAHFAGPAPMGTSPMSVGSSLSYGADRPSQVYVSSLNAASPAHDVTIWGDVRFRRTVEADDSAGTPITNPEDGITYYTRDLASGPPTDSGIPSIYVVEGEQDDVVIPEDADAPPVPAFVTDLFGRDGRPLVDPSLNVIVIPEPPLLQYAGMFELARGWEPDIDEDARLNPGGNGLFFNTGPDFLAWLANQDPLSPIGSGDYRVMQVGTLDAPAFIYIAGDLDLELTGSLDAMGTPDQEPAPTAADMTLDRFLLYGGMYVAGNVTLTGPEYVSPAQPQPQIEIVSLPFCLPALVAHREPATLPAGGRGDLKAADTPDDVGVTGVSILANVTPTTPPVGQPTEGRISIEGLVFASNNLSALRWWDPEEEAQFRGLVMANRVSFGNHVQFAYDPEVICTRFLVGDDTAPAITGFTEER